MLVRLLGFKQQFVFRVFSTCLASLKSAGLLARRFTSPRHARELRRGSHGMLLILQILLILLIITYVIVIMIANNCYMIFVYVSAWLPGCPAACLGRLAAQARGLVIIYLCIIMKQYIYIYIYIHTYIHT